MKAKIFQRMREFGWNLDCNTDECYESVYKIHYDNMQDLFEFLHLLGDYEDWYEDETCINLNDLDQQKLTDMVDFMSDFLRALNDIEKESNENE